MERVKHERRPRDSYADGESAVAEIEPDRDFIVTVSITRLVAVEGE